ncbi:MAG: S-layer homology domain-containing protein, partial [Oscillospiraceae bacterium]|nr:S-layer homology domain-containing protein [Oscillospiraceae bacterium]
PEGFATSNVYFVNGDDYAITSEMISAFTVNAKTNADVTVTFASNANVTEDGVLCWIEYVVPSAVGEYEVTANVSELYTADDLTNNLASASESVAGTLTVVQPVVSAGSVSADNSIGTCVLVPITIKNSIGFAGMTLTVSVPEDWTTTNVYFVNGDDYAITSEMTSVFRIDAKSNGDVTVTFASADDVTDDGVLCWVEYTWTGSVEEGEYDVGVTVDEAYVAADLATNLASYFATENGTITVSTFGIALDYSGAATVGAGDTVTMTACVTGSGDYSSTVFSLTYDSSLFTFVSAEGAESVATETAGVVSFTMSEAGNVTFSFTANSVTGVKTGTFSLSYSYTGSSNVSPSVSDAVTVAIAPVVTAGSVAADNKVGTCVLVPISIEDNAGFAGMTLTVSVPEDWTTTNVYFVNGDDYAITADMTSAFQINAKNNNDVTVTFASSDNVTGDGVLCWIEYTWTGSVEEGEYDVSVTVDEAYAADDLTTNLASYYTAEGGTITVSSYGYSISVDADSVTAGDTVTVTLTVTGDNTEDAVFYVTYSSDLFTFVSAEGATATDGDGAVALTLTEAGTVTLTFTANDCEESATGEFSTYYIYSGATQSSTAQSVKVSYTKYYTVTLKTSSGSEIASYSVSAGSTVGSVLTEDDLSAGDSAGWIISGGDGTKYTSEEVLAMTVTDDITFRVYKKSSSGGGSSGSSSGSTNTDNTGTVDTTDTTMNTTPIEIAATEIMTADEATAAVAAMTDVDSTAYYYDATLWAVQNGIINGTSDVTFDPEIGCTRAMIVTLLYRLAGTPEFGISDTGFIDVSESAYYYDAVLWAVENGITNGVSDDMFAPDLICTREQIVTLMYRFVGQPETDAELIFTDVNPDYYSTNAIIWAYANGITDGIGDNQFGPTLDCTRAQVVTFLYRFAQL